MKMPRKNDSMPTRIRKRAMDMAMSNKRGGGAPMPPAMADAPMMASPMAAPMSPGATSAMKKGGAVKEKGSKEVYASKAAMKKHEAGEGKAKEAKEHKMRGGGVATRGMGVALKKGGPAKRPGLMVMIAVGKGKKK
jgi:hypothetical protein